MCYVPSHGHAPIRPHGANMESQGLTSALDFGRREDGEELRLVAQLLFANMSPQEQPDRQIRLDADMYYQWHIMAPISQAKAHDKFLKHGEESPFQQFSKRQRWGTAYQH